MSDESDTWREDFTRSVIATLHKAEAEYRERNELGPEQPLVAVVPDWLPDLGEKWEPCATRIPGGEPSDKVQMLIAPAGSFFYREGPSLDLDAVLAEPPDERTRFWEEFIGPVDVGNGPEFVGSMCDCECCSCCAGRAECIAPEECYDRGCGTIDGKRLGES